MQINVRDGGAGVLDPAEGTSSGVLDVDEDEGLSFDLEDHGDDGDDDVFINPSSICRVKRSTNLPRSTSTTSVVSARSLDGILRASSGSENTFCLVISYLMVNIILPY